MNRVSKLSTLSVVLVVAALAASLLVSAVHVHAATEQGSVGLEGRISAPPPTTPATISIPRSGQAFSTLPVTVSGICPNKLLVKLFKNNVFAGSVQCTNGSYSLIIDLFDGQNDLIARVYDDLDQAGPDSNVVAVSYNADKPGFTGRVSLTSTIAKKGANPGQSLSWPIVLSGGDGPYAVSVDWGDGKTPDLMSRAFPGDFNIQHVYDKPGVYNIIVKATDKNGGVAYLQLVGIANGALSQDTGSANNSSANSGNNAAAQKTKILWQPAAILIPFIISTFWLGKKYQMHVLRQKIERGDRPF
jgi:hypothetical protein